MARYDRSGETVGDFCVEEGVTVASFYYWKQKLSVSSGFESKATRTTNGMLADVAKVQGKKTRTTGTSQTDETVPAGPGFQRVHVTPVLSSHRTTIRVPGGMVIELGDNLSVVEAVTTLLLERCQEGTATC